MALGATASECVTALVVRQFRVVYTHVDSIGYPGTELKRPQGATVPHGSACAAVPLYKRTSAVEVGPSLSTVYLGSAHPP